MHIHMYKMYTHMCTCTFVYTVHVCVCGTCTVILFQWDPALAVSMEQDLRIAVTEGKEEEKDVYIYDGTSLRR